MLQKLKKNYFLLIITFLIFYFFFNLLSGERGLISYFEKKDQLNTLKAEESLLKNQIKTLDNGINSPWYVNLNNFNLL